MYAVQGTRVQGVIMQASSAGLSAIEWHEYECMFAALYTACSSCHVVGSS